jgi:hypothetical protein
MTTLISQSTLLRMLGLAFRYSPESLTPRGNLSKFQKSDRVNAELVARATRMEGAHMACLTRSLRKGSEY